MSPVAVVTLTDGLLPDDALIGVWDGDACVAQGTVPDRVEHGGRLAPARICKAIADLGYRPVDYYNRQRRVEAGLEVDVERVS